MGKNNKPSLMQLYSDPVKIYEIARRGYFYYKGRRYIIKKLPNGFWNIKTTEVLVRYILLDKLRWGREEICNNLTAIFLCEYGMNRGVKLFKGSIYNLISTCLPEFKIKPWELKVCPNGFWQNPENCKEMLLWLIEKEGYKGKEDEFCASITFEMLYKYGVGRATTYIGGLYELINYTFPGKYKPWDLKRVAKIDDEMVINATKWLIEEKLNWSFEDVCNNITAKVFYDNGLGAILCHGCKHSPLIALEKTYPGVYKKKMLLKGLNNPFRQAKDSN